MQGKITTALVLCLAALFVFGGCANAGDPLGGNGSQTIFSGGGVSMQKQTNTLYKDYDGEPYVVRTALKEYTSYDPKTGKGAYGRYTELTVEGKAPDTFRDAVEQYNQRAKETLTTQVDESVRTRAAQAGKPLFGSGNVEDEYVTIGCIVNVTRADHEAFSFLETEYVQGPGKTTSDITYRFSGATFDTESGEEISLSDLGWDEEKCAEELREAISDKYGWKDGVPETDPSNYAWTADAVGIRFYFNLDTVPWEKRWEIGDHTARPVTVAFRYSDLYGEKAEALSSAPEAYIAMLERNKQYDLPHGDLSIQLTGTDDNNTLLTLMHDGGETEDLVIEHGDKLSDYYIMRAEGGFYLFRERYGYQEGFYYDFSRPDGGYGRFAYNTCQFFDSFLGDLDFAVPYNPYCAHMAEVRRSFGDNSYGAGSFVPNGHYTFPSEQNTRYKIFVLTDESLSIDTRGTACRLLEDFPAVRIDEEGKELGDVIVAAGKYLIFESVEGEDTRYDVPTRRSESRTFWYNCRVSDGMRIRFSSDTDSSVSTELGFMNRYTEPVNLAEALSAGGSDASDTEPSVETFYVTIGGRDYPLIPDYSQPNHLGEEIDFGGDIWWQAEGYVGTYELTDEDREDMQDAWYTPGQVSDPDSHASLVISEDGSAVLDYFGEIFRGTLSEKRYYHTYVTIFMESDTERRSFEIRLREGNWHDVPVKIDCFAEGALATNEPPEYGPLEVYLTKTDE